MAGQLFLVGSKMMKSLPDWILASRPASCQPAACRARHARHLQFRGP